MADPDRDYTPMAAVVDGFLEATIPSHRQACLRSILASNLLNYQAINGPGHSPLVRAIAAFQTDAALELLTAGADPNLASRTGMTPLAAAADVKDVKVVEALLARGVDLSCLTREGGFAPLAFALAGSSVPSAALASLVLAQCPDPLDALTFAPPGGFGSALYEFAQAVHANTRPVANEIVLDWVARGIVSPARVAALPEEQQQIFREAAQILKKIGVGLLSLEIDTPLIDAAPPRAPRL